MFADLFPDHVLTWTHIPLIIVGILQEVLPGAWNDNHNIIQMKVTILLFKIISIFIKRFPDFPWPLYFSRFSLTFQVGGNPNIRPDPPATCQLYDLQYDIISPKACHIHVHIHISVLASLTLSVTSTTNRSRYTIHSPKHTTTN